MIKMWINLPTRGDEGFTPLHFASFHGNVKLIKLLVRCGSNVFARNKQGINMLHVGAQGDQAYSLTYFRLKGVPLHQTDDEKSTPLHWACFAGADTAIYYLLAWGADVNQRDNIGYTPLHLAVKSAEHFPNTRSIKELLIKGAKRNAVDNEGKRPIDLTDHIQYNLKLKKDIAVLLKQKKSAFCPCCHVKQPLQKLTPNHRTLSIYVIFQLLSYFALLTLVLPCKYRTS